MKKFISTSISYNFEKEDVLTALKLLFLPHILVSGSYVNRVENWFRYNYSKKYAYTFCSFYEAEYALLKSLQLGSKDEVLIHAINPKEVIDPMLSLGIKPVLVDICKKDFSISVSDLRRKIRKKTKAIIIKHFSGLPTDMKKIRSIAKSKKIVLIEDCSDIIENSGNKKLGQIGDAAIFSFEKGKSVSSITGGVIVTNKRRIADKIKRIKDISPYPSIFWIYYQIMYMISIYLAYSGFNVHYYLGKFLMSVLKKIKIISLPILPEENEPYFKHFKSRRYPNSLAMICFRQLSRLGKFNKNRAEIFKVYKKELDVLEKRVWLPEKETYFIHVPLIFKYGQKIIEYCKRKNLYFDNLNSVIKENKEYRDIFYRKGSCKIAEKVSKNVVLLPCYPRMTIKDAKRVTEEIKSFFLNLKN